MIIERSRINSSINHYYVNYNYIPLENYPLNKTKQIVSEIRRSYVINCHWPPIQKMKTYLSIDSLLINNYKLSDLFIMNFI